ncbi:MAG: pyridoxamine 5'-phosphate oxidase family protein, partial [Ketobacter sp.]
MSKSTRKELWEALDDSPFIMIGLNANDEHSEPMTVQLDKNADSEFWIFTTKTNRIAQGGPAMAQFSSKNHKVFACISGTLKTEDNPQIVDKFWSNPVDSWYELGRDDPSLCVMRFELKDAEVWTVHPGIKGMFK